jgi:phosphopantetheinyl transferase
LRELARRSVLEVVRAWGFLAANLVEEATGPRLDGCGDLSLSLSYAPDQIWIAIAHGSSVGIDAASVRAFEGMSDVARLYLGPSAAAIDSPEAFAEAWSRHEATLKYHRLPLREWDPHTPKPPRHLTVREEGFAVSVVLEASA